MIQMSERGINGQKLAKMSGVSDSEVSRILTGKSRPGLDNAFRIARALELSLDYLADDAAEGATEPREGPIEREVSALMSRLSPTQARRLLETALDLGFEVAIRRLLGVDPIVAAEPRDSGRMMERSIPSRRVDQAR